MRELPTGTVTFLFTDVEGSTRLLEELGVEGFAAALGEHRRVLRKAFAAQGGVEVDTQGDAFFVAFPTAPGALRAAGDAQGGLVGGPIRVRIGLHTGTPLVAEGSYVGMDVHRAARIAAAAHGGQTVVSASTAALVDGASLVDLGQHRFKDLAAPERVFQLGDGEFPPLKSLYRTNLPVPATPFLGRERELGSVVELVADARTRLITLTGPGGTGKTRLALQAAAEAADEFPDGVWWVPLAALRDSSLVLPTAARVLDISDESNGQLEQALGEAVGGKRLLLVLDNAEHLLPDVAGSLTALVGLAGPTLLVTSRERLRVQGEHVFAVPSLSPDDGRSLFVTRARQVDHEFVETTAVPELCRRLDDLPLALELAAARTALFTPEQLLERLSERLDLLRGGRDADPRQETLRTTIAWSHDLLDAAEQRLFAALAVFFGGATYAAAEAVCGANPDTLQSLIDKSLIRRRDTGREPRYWMLETVRGYAAQQLDGLDEAHELRRRHAEFFTDLAEAADPHLRRGPDQQGWADRIAEDYDNVRAAVQFALTEASDLALRLVASLTFFVWLRGGFVEARAWVEAALMQTVGQPAGLVGRLHECAAVVSERLGDRAGAARHADEAYAVFAAAGDEHGMANALRERGKAAASRGDTTVARPLYEELAELAERIGDDWNGAIALNNLGDLALQTADWERVVELCGRSSAIRRGLGDRWGSSLALTNVAIAEVQLGRLAAAGRTLRVAVAETLEIGATMVLMASLDAAAVLASVVERTAEGAQLLGASQRLHDELGSVREEFEVRLVRRTTERLRVALGEEAFVAAFERGAALSTDEAAGCALAVSATASAAID